MEFKTLCDVLSDAVERYSDRTAFSLWRGGMEVSYAEVGRRVERVQQMFLEAGLKPGDRIALLSSNTPNWGVCYFAITTAGYVVVPIVTDLTTEAIDNIIAHSEAKALCVSDRLFMKLSKETLQNFNIVVRTKNLKVLNHRVVEKGEMRRPQPEDTAAILYTSGTTSQPKGVMLSHRSLVSQLPMIEALFDMSGEDVLLSVLPLAHSYECTIGFLAPFTRGAQIVYLDKAPVPSVLMPALREVAPTIMFTVPLFIEKLYRTEVRKRMLSNIFVRLLGTMDFSRRMLSRRAAKHLTALFGGRLRIFGIGGAKLDTAVERFLSESGFNYTMLYGLTETAPLLVGGFCDGHVGSTGFALKGVETRLDKQSATTGIGELVVKTPSLMSGYYKNEEATAEVIEADGWFHTGDLACIDPAGHIYIKGRKKNVIVGPNGENIYPEDIEAVLNEHFAVSESVVVERDGMPVAFVHLDRDLLEAHHSDLAESWRTRPAEWERFRNDLFVEMKRYVNARVNPWSRLVDIFEEKNELVKTASNKIKRYIYNDRFKNNL